MAQPVVCVELQRAMWWATQEELAGSDVGGAGADGFSGGDMAGEPCGSQQGAECAICLEAMHEGDRLGGCPCDTTGVGEFVSVCVCACVVGG